MEANKSDYFVDGFLIKNFNIWPPGVNKENLFYEQKVFVVYLMGVIPDNKNWNLNVEYQTKLKEIENIKDVELSDTDLDVAELQGRDIEEIRKERIKSEKERKIQELNEKFGIKNNEEENEDEFGFSSSDKENKDTHQELWDLLQGNGIIKEKDGRL